MKRVTLAIILAILGISSWAQETRNEVTLQGSGFFNKKTTNGGITNEPTNSGGVMAGYRFNVKKWLSVEGDYDYFRNSQKSWSIGGSTSIPMNVHAATGAAIVKLPSFKVPAVKIVSPFVLSGGGGMFFDPREGAVSEQTRGAFLYGGGLDLPVAKHIDLRAQYRGFVYKAPDFEMASFKIDKYTHSAVPSAGLVFKF